MRTNLLTLQNIAAPYFTIAVCRSHEIAEVSHSATKLLGYPKNELVGSKLSLILARDELNEDVLNRVTKRFEENVTTPVNSLHVLVDASGSKHLVHLQCLGEQNEFGRMSRVVGVGLDLSSAWPNVNSLYTEMKGLGKIHDSLKSRERVVLSKVLSGRLNKSIARELEVSERTIELDRKKLIEKFSAANSAELISKAARLRVLEELWQSIQSSHDFVEAGVLPMSSSVSGAAQLGTSHVNGSND